MHVPKLLAGSALALLFLVLPLLLVLGDLGVTSGQMVAIAILVQTSAVGLMLWLQARSTARSLRPRGAHQSHAAATRTAKPD